MNRYLEAGKIVNTHGVRGEIKIQPWADSPEFLLDFDTVRIDQNDYAVRAARVHKSCVLMELEGVQTLEAAMALRDRVVYVDREQAQLEEGAVFIADLIGLHAVSDSGEVLGEITDVLTLPGNDVYVIRGEREYMVPAVAEFVKEIDLASGCVTLHLIEGMQSDG